MTLKKIIYIGLSLTVVLSANCKKPYDPPAIAASGTHLVVEGVIDPGSDTTVFRLTRTVSLSSAAGSVPELGAQVIVANNAGSAFPLIETGKGYYQALLNLSANSTYQLRILTKSNSTYASDFVAVKNSSPIDSVNYTIKSNGVQLFVSTHDPSGNSRYYRWAFTDTYLYHSAFYSNYYHAKTPQDTILYRNVNQQIYSCWRGDTSTTIFLGSSAKLSGDVINQAPLNFIASDAEQIGDLYSILVKQYVLSTDAYNYWQQLKTNTEQLGSIFDAQPSQLPSNIHCISNPAETVIGYISAGAYAQKRFYVDSRKLPAWIPANRYGSCKLDNRLFKYVDPGTKQIINQVAEFIYTDQEIPIDAIQPPGLQIILGYTASTPDCVDCTLRGTNIKPSFWP
jgi:hypothetical protein